MLRNIDLELKNWTQSNPRKPLLLRGARQVGKTYAVEKLGREHFTSFCKIDFELEPELRTAFEIDLIPERILRDLSSRKNVKIIEGETLLFFDEIQACPRALMALRYFYEMMPSLHVIGASSLLEFILHEPDFSFPVGRIQSLYVKPFSFQEFLQVKGATQALGWIQESTVKNPLGKATHLSLLQLLKEYFIWGGMPGVLFGNQEVFQSRIEARSILEMYSNDFGKYSKYSQQKYLRLLFEKAPYVMGEHFKFSKIDPHADSRALKTALDLLFRSSLIHRISCSSASGLPLAAQINAKKFKLLFLDIGLLNSKLGTPLDFLTDEDLTLIHSGALAEQFVGQELIAYSTPYYAPELFYWEREKKGSEAEVDYLITLNGQIYPIEVKAGKLGRMRSLRQFMMEKEIPLGLRISQAPLSCENGILSIPLYMVSEIPRLV